MLTHKRTLSLVLSLLLCLSMLPNVAVLAETDCTHPNATTETVTYPTLCIDGADGHHYVYESRIRLTCPDCGYVDSGTLADVQPTPSPIESHFFEEEFMPGFCTICEYECPHPDPRLELIEYSHHYDYTYIDSVSHTVTDFMTVGRSCSICKAVYWEEIDHLKTENHLWEKDGTCICGATNECSHPNLIDQGEIEHYIGAYSADDNSEFHYGRFILRHEEYCPDCGQLFYEEIGETYEKLIPHVWNELGKQCTECYDRNPCKHPQIASSEKWEKFLYITNITEANHSSLVVGMQTCPDCGAFCYDYDFSGPYEVTEAHDWDDNGICIQCGYERKTPDPTATPTVSPTDAPTPEPTAVPTETPAAEPTAAPTESPTAEPTAAPTETPAAEPTAAPTETPAAEPTAAPTESPAAEPTDVPATTPADPTATPTAIPTVTPTDVPAATPQPSTVEPTAVPEEPTVVYTDVPASETVHGVSSSTPLRMAETLVTAVEQIELENSGKVVSFEILHADKVFTAEEKASLDVLPLKEQILVMLSVIGQGDEVTAAMVSMNIELSDDANVLISAVQERLEGATESEKAAFEQLLLECFPVETITIEGVTYDYFVVELYIAVDGNAHIEHYGFRHDENGEWVFTKLSIGTISDSSSNPAV